MTVHVLYENPDWLPPLTGALESRRIPVALHALDGGTLDLTQPPPEGVFINRMSPSAHTRGHQGGVTFVKEYLALLEAHGRPVLNGSQAFGLEVSKIRQDVALRRAGIRTPDTIAVVGRAGLKAAGRKLGTPFVTKHNQGGKGLGVQLFRDLAAFDAYVDGPDFIEGPDGITLLQRYIEPAEPFITRVEIVDGQFLYAIRSSTVGGFELCPADACAIEEDAFCPVDGGDTFTLREDLTADDPLVQAYIRFLADNDIDLAGIEFVEDADGVRYTYDVNGTTNFNQTLELQHGLDGMGAIAELARRRLGEVQAAAAK